MHKLSLLIAIDTRIPNTAKSSEKAIQYFHMLINNHHRYKDLHCYSRHFIIVTSKTFLLILPLLWIKQTLIDKKVLTSLTTTKVLNSRGNLESLSPKKSKMKTEVQETAFVEHRCWEHREERKQSDIETKQET